MRTPAPSPTESANVLNQTHAGRAEYMTADERARRGLFPYRRASSGDSDLQTPHTNTLPRRHPATASQYAHLQRDEANHTRSSAVSGTTNRIDSSLSPERVSDSTSTQRRLPQAQVDPENRFHASTLHLQWLALLWDVRACFICDERGPCRHREPDVDLAELAPRVLQPIAEKARVA